MRRVYRELPALWVGMHFVLTLKPVSEMPGPDARWPVGENGFGNGGETSLLDELRTNWRVSISVSSTYLAASQRISTVTIMRICSRKFPISSPACGAARDCVTRADRQTVLNEDDLPSDLRSTKDLVVNFTARRSPKRAFTHSDAFRRIE